jgi:hypothetical protein
MQEHRSHPDRDLEGQGSQVRALSVSLATIVVQARRLPRGSVGREALREASTTMVDALGDLTAARRVSLARALSVAEAAVGADLAVWGRDDAFRAGPVLRRRLSQVGVSGLAELNVDEADELEAFIAARAA